MDVNMNGGILHLYDFTEYYFGQNRPLKLALILFLPKIRFGPLVAHISCPRVPKRSPSCAQVVPKWNHSDQLSVKRYQKGLIG